MIEPVGQGQNQGQGEGFEQTQAQPQNQTQGQKRSALIAVVVLVVVVALALIAYNALASAGKESAASTASQYAISDSEDAADDTDSAQTLACEVVTFDGQDTTFQKISDGKPLVVNLWATWCPYCVAEMEDYQKLYDTYGNDVQFVMLNVCDTAREVSLAREYVADNGFTFPVYYDADHQVVNLFGVRAYPTTIILSDGGHVLMNRPGQIDYDSMDATLAALTGK